MSLPASAVETGREALRRAQVFTDGPIRTLHAWRFSLRKAIPRKQEQAGIHLVAVEHADVACICSFQPRSSIWWRMVFADSLYLQRTSPQHPALTQTNEAIHCSPAQESRMSWFSRPHLGSQIPSSAGPNSLKRKSPKPINAFCISAVKVAAMKCELRRRVDHFSINIQLQLISRRVPNAHWLRSAVSAQVCEFPFRAALSP